MSTNPPRPGLSRQQAALVALVAAQRIAQVDDAKLVAFASAQTALDGVTEAQLRDATMLAQEIAEARDGFDTLLDMLAAALGDAHAAAAYMLAADFIAQNGRVSPEEMRFLERLGDALSIDRLTRAAFDSAAQARATSFEAQDNG